MQTLHVFDKIFSDVAGFKVTNTNNDIVTYIDTSDANAITTDILPGKTAYVNGEKIEGNMVQRASEDITITGPQITISPGYYPQSLTKTIPSGSITDEQLSINENGLLTRTTSITSGYQSSHSRTLTYQLPTKSAETITPSTIPQTIEPNVYLIGPQTILGDENLIPENIAYGVSIFGVSGSYSKTWRAFIENRNQLTELSEFDTVSTIHDGTFMNCRFSIINCPLCTNIGSYAFAYCSSLASVNFPECTFIKASAFYNCSSLTEINFPECIDIQRYAFAFCSSFTSIDFPKCTSIGVSAFTNCYSLTSVNFPECTNIESYAFYNCSSLTEINFPECTNIGSSAFAFCLSLTSVNFPECISIKTQAFRNCDSLASVSFPLCNRIGSNAFTSCSSLTSIDFPECTYIESQAFQYCSSLATINFPECNYIEEYAFRSCTSLISINFPECSYIRSSAFYGCSSLTSISFPKCISIGNSAFYNCQNLTTAYFLSSSIPTLENSAFTGTKITSSTGTIYIKSGTIDYWKVATNWTIYSSRFVEYTGT